MSLPALLEEAIIHFRRISAPPGSRHTRANRLVQEQRHSRSVAPLGNLMVPTECQCQPPPIVHTRGEQESFLRAEKSGHSGLGRQEHGHPASS